MKELKGKILAGNVLVKPSEPEEKTASGIIIPDTAKEKPQHGIVVMIGSSKKKETMEIKVGDRLLYRKFAGQEFTIDDVDYLLLSQSDVLFISN